MSRILIAMLAIVAGLVALAGLPAHAAAQKRVALVIGNGAYTKAPRLDNPRNDAAAMEAMFKAAGFDAVVRVNDVGVAAMRRALRDFFDVAHDTDVAVVYYAGHGIEVGGTNYLIPIDAALERDTDVQDEAISLDRVNQMLEPAKRLRLVILDACRDNPFARSMRRTIATRTVRSGYGEIDERSLPPNTLVAYAQRAGLTADDGVGSNNSPYTTALLKHLLTPGLDVELALRRVRDEVLQATKNRQEPFKYGSLGGAELPLVSAVAGTSTTQAKDTTGTAVLEAELKKKPATLAEGTQISAKRPFEGTWTVGGVNEGPQCPAQWQSWTHYIKIEANTVFSADGTKGKISASGEFEYTYQSQGGTRGTYTGRLSDRSGTGRYKHVVCFGSLQLKRI